MSRPKAEEKKVDLPAEATENKSTDEPKKDTEPTTGNSDALTSENPKSEKKETKIFSERFKGKKLIGKNGVEITFDKDGFVEGELDDEQKQRLIAIGFCEKEVEE